MQLFKKYCLLLLMLVMVACQQRVDDSPQRVSELFSAAIKGDKAAFAELKALGNKGNADALFYLAAMYERGEGVPKDSVQAIFWYRKSANQGNASGQFALGTMYEKGTGVPKDLAQAIFWFRKGAEQGSSSAQSALGAMYYRGDGVPKDLVMAYMWRNLAAAQGSEIAKKARESLEKDMTPAQIAEGQRLSREWRPKP